MRDQVQITKKGLESLKEELHELQEVKRPNVVERLANARSQGDLSENSDYHNARDELEFLDGRISQLEDVLQNAVVVGGNGKTGEVSVGTTVELKVDGSHHEYEIVGEWEADPSAKKISHTSPLGQALVGKKVGESVEVEAPAGIIKYEILSIS
jgi:transcription elongation factor GreA